MQTENTYVETDLGNIALNPRGEYSDEVSYEYLDTVSYEGGSYICVAELGKSISGIAPAQGKNTEHWQMLTLPGQLTPEAVAMHDDVVSKAKQVETSRAAVELSQQEVEVAQVDVRQMRQDTQEASQAAIVSRDSAAGCAQSAEASRTAAKESEDNVKAQESKVVQSVIEEGTKQIKAVSNKAMEQIGAVNTAGSKQVSTIETKGADQVKTIQKASENALQNIGNGVDKGLSEEGKAADAKATGEAISKLTEDLAEYVFAKTKNVNLLDIDDSDVQHGFYNSSNGEYTANVSALTSGFIPYESDSVYRFTFPTAWFNYSVTLWDEKKSIVLADLSSFISKENGYATFSSTTYSNAKYVRFTIFDTSNDFSTAMVVKDVEYPSTYIPYDYTVKYSKKLDREIENIAKNINPVTIFDNKVMLFTGDSICYGANWRPTVEDYSNTGWRKIIQENYPKSITYGYGIGGTTISKRSGRTDSILERMTTMFSEHPEADYIIIEGGVNDAYNITDCPIGTISTGYTAELNENTFAGALESIFKYAQTNWIGKKIGYIVTFKVPSAMGQFKFNEYMDITKQICEKWSIPYCDLYNESNLNYYIQEVSNAYGGGLHPNEAGYRIITNKIEKWLETL